MYTKNNYIYTYLLRHPKNNLFTLLLTMRVFTNNLIIKKIKLLFRTMRIFFCVTIYYNYTLRKKGTKVVTGAVPFQMVHFLTLVVHIST